MTNPAGVAGSSPIEKKTDADADPGPKDAARPPLMDRNTADHLAYLIGAFVFAALALMITFGAFDWIADELGVARELWSAFRVIVAAVIVLIAFAWLLTVWHGEAYLAAFWFMIPRFPGLLAVGWLLAYLAPAVPNGPPALPLAVGLWIVVLVWLLILIPLRRTAEIPTAQPETYRELVTRYNQINSRVTAMHSPTPRAHNPAALEEAKQQLKVVQRLLSLPEDGAPGPQVSRERDADGGMEWATATGYISAWEALNRADEALIDAATVEDAIGEGLHDMLRLSGSQITNADHLQDALRAAVRQHSPEIDALYFYPQRRRMADPIGATADAAVGKNTSAKPGTPPNDALTKEVIREVRHAVNVYRTSHASALIRARARLSKAILATGIVADVLLALAILMQVPRGTLAVAAVFFLVGGVVGLLNRLRLEGEGGPAMTPDYGLFDARLLGTLLISGLAGIAGVVLVSVAPLANTITVPGSDVVLSLDKVFSLEQNRVGLVTAALFGLTPELIFGALRKQTDAIKKEVSSTEAAVSGSLGGDSPTR
jgi:hypothetical protein